MIQCLKKNIIPMFLSALVLTACSDSVPTETKQSEVPEEEPVMEIPVQPALEEVVQPAADIEVPVTQEMSAFARKGPLVCKPWTAMDPEKRQKHRSRISFANSG
jgi:hypothetical protein